MGKSLLIGISYCGTHNKGDAVGTPAAVMVPPRLHAEWLYDAVSLVYGSSRRMGLPDRPRLLVSAVGLPPILQITEPGERDALWNVLSVASLLSWPMNPGHQVGASVALRQGLEAAGYWGYEYYLHTAEDILPYPGAVNKMLQALDEGNDYAGFLAGPDGCLNCAFFACRTSYLAGVFDYERVRDFPGLEHYLAHLFEGRPKWVVDARGFYVTTHDYEQYKRWLEKMPDDPAPPCVRVMDDYREGKEKG